MLTAFDVAIAGYIHRGAADVAVVDGMWVIHNAIFGFLLASIGIALAGLTHAPPPPPVCSRPAGARLDSSAAACSSSAQ